MSSIKKMLIIIISIILLFSGCSNNSQETKIIKNNSDMKIVGLSMHFMRDDYAINLAKEFSERMESEGIRYIITDGNGDPKKQLADIENLIAKKVDVIGVCPMDEKAIKNSLNTAIEAGIPVIAVTKIPEVNVIATISGSDYVNGKGAGEAMLKALNGKGKIVEMDFPFDVYRIKERIRGFNDAINGSDIKIVAKYRPATNEETMDVVKEIIKNYPDINGIFASFSNQTIGCGAALKALNNKNIVVTGIDADMSIINLIIEGWIFSSAAQFPKEHGRLTADAIIRVLKGESNIVNNDVHLKMVDKDNAIEMANVLWGKNIKANK